MKKILSRSFAVAAFCLISAFAVGAQEVSPAVLIRVVRAEDELRFDRDLIELLKSPNAKIRVRAALASGRIGDEKAIPMLAEMLDKDANAEARAMSAFALGEIENVAAADAVLQSLDKPAETGEVRARLTEAAGKIAAMIAPKNKDEKPNEQFTELGETILDVLEAEFLKPARHRTTVLLGITAVLRARPADAEIVVGKFLSDKDARIRADALNTLVRLRAKNEDLTARSRTILISDDDAVVRANAARALGASEDKIALDLLIEAATTDEDQRVRVAAIRSLASLKDKKAAAPLITRGETLLREIRLKTVGNGSAGLNKQYKPFYPFQQNELLEIAVVLGSLLKETNDVKATTLLYMFLLLDGLQSTEIAVAAAKISPNFFHGEKKISFESNKDFLMWRTQLSIKSGLSEAANLSPTPENEILRKESIEWISQLIKVKVYQQYEKQENDVTKAIPDMLRGYATFKTDDLPQVLGENLMAKDEVIRAAAAELLGEMPFNETSFAALKRAFVSSLEKDRAMNDAQLAILSALVKLNKMEAAESLQIALDAPDFLVRRHAANLIKQNDLTKDFPNFEAKVGTVRGIAAGRNVGTLGIILNRPEDYARAVARKNRTTKAVFTTDKGVFTIDLLPEDAPLTVDNFVKLARSNYFNGIAFHRVVPNFVVQDGDPRGDGNGGPGWQIRCEINTVEYERGAIGMALSGKDTGGSQWFATHSPQPHLDGGYTVFGRVDAAGMKVVDQIARGDKILTVKIVEARKKK